MRLLKLVQIVVLALALVVLPVSSQAVTYYTAYKSVVLAWDDNQTDVDRYEVILVRDVSLVQYGPYTTPSGPIIIEKET